ncbi:Tas retrotransposon peptidase A16 [Teladorsagia circumcincta]|uniref:Tas retrotransposon peptidase A16 n=1 Tax=Teladorsagia circumcincta TaxID=45464 RepID=A0A2G9V2K9_TELCI|nr:Tas retrotransposon peptidase A16 [Teladorsagia circumcincta]
MLNHEGEPSRARRSFIPHPCLRRAPEQFANVSPKETKHIPRPPETNVIQIVSSPSPSEQRRVALQATLMCSSVSLFNPTDSSKETAVTAFFDSGSTQSYVTDELAQLLDLKNMLSEEITVSTFGTTTPLRLKSRNHVVSIRTEKGGKHLQVKSLPTLTGHLRHARPDSNPKSGNVAISSCKPSIVIGNDYSWDIVLSDDFCYETLPDGYRMLHTSIGNILVGTRLNPKSMATCTFLDVEGDPSSPKRSPPPPSDPPFMLPRPHPLPLGGRTDDDHGMPTEPSTIIPLIGKSPNPVKTMHSTPRKCSTKAPALRIEAPITKPSSPLKSTLPPSLPLPTTAKAEHPSPPPTEPPLHSPSHPLPPSILTTRKPRSQPTRSSIPTSPTRPPSPPLTRKPKSPLIRSCTPLWPPPLRSLSSTTRRPKHTHACNTSTPQPYPSSKLKFKPSISSPPKQLTAAPIQPSPDQGRDSNRYLNRHRDDGNTSTKKKFFAETIFVLNECAMKGQIQPMYTSSFIERPGRDLKKSLSRRRDALVVNRLKAR